VPTRDPLRRFGYLTPRIVYALAMLRELAVSLPIADPPPRAAQASTSARRRSIAPL